MKNQKTQSKIIVAMSAVILLLVALSATLTFAWFSASQNSTNTSMTFGKLALNAENGFALTGDAHALTEVIPGCTIGIGGTVELSGNINAFVRTQLKVFKLDPESGVAALDDNANPAQVEGTAVGEYVKLTETFVDASGDGSPADKYYKILAVVSGYVAVESANVNTPANHTQVIFNKVYDVMNETAGTWISYGGYMYYKQAVQADDDTVNTVLDFEDAEISLQNTLDNSWQGEKFAISLGAKAIQAGHLTGDVAETDEFALEAGNDKKAVSVLHGQAAWNA
jgi:hypothetical protein